MRGTNSFSTFLSTVGAICLAMQAPMAHAASGPASTPSPSSSATSAPQPARWVEMTKASSENELPGSVFAVVISKGGVAASLAHNHFVRASEYQLVVSPGSSPVTPQEVRLRFATKALVVDDPSVIAAAGARLKQLGIAHAEFTKLSDSDRASIGKNMLADDQLAADKFPVIEVVASDFRQQAGKIGNESSNTVADFVFNIRGKSVKKTIPLAVSQATAAGPAGPHSPIIIEGLVSARFEEFGFKAYSGLLGAVRNNEEFHFYFRTQGQWNP